MSFETGGFLQTDDEVRDNFDRSTLAVTLEGRSWVSQAGTWTANGTTLSTSTARGSDPRVVVEASFADFDMAVDCGLGDALYLRFVDNSNWLRVTQHMDYSTAGFQCNPYQCNGFQCNPYQCNGFQCNPYQCNGYQCNGFQCNGYSCNCRDTYGTGTNTTSQHGCKYHATYAYPASCSGPCDSCCYPGCASGSTDTGQYTCYFTSGTCTKYTGQVCDTCYSTCYQTCYQTCYETCYSTCYDTCYQTCYDTCYNYYYPTYLRLEKFVAGSLSLVTSVNLGQHYANNGNADYRTTRIRVIGKGQNIRVFTHHNLSANPAINSNVAEHQFARKFGLGRVGYGNQDSGTVLDNLVLTNAK